MNNSVKNKEFDDNDSCRLEWQNVNPSIITKRILFI